MLEAIEVTSTTENDETLPRVRDTLEGVFPGLVVRRSIIPASLSVGHLTRFGHLVVVPARVWQAKRFDLFTLDDLVARVESLEGGVALRIEAIDESEEPETTALQILTRYQRYLSLRNRESANRLFDRVMLMHRGLHDRTRPLVAADYDHALDTWRWVLRLNPEASMATQLAALFHDVERLVSEANERREQFAADYVGFKMAHARAGARIARRALEGAGAPAELVDEVESLVAGHERPDDDPARQLVNEADALSFFSLNAPGFLKHYGRAHTERKVAYTLSRLGARGWAELARIRHQAAVQEVIATVLTRYERPQPSLRLGGASLQEAHS
jgi:hypothetical protein